MRQTVGDFRRWVNYSRSDFAHEWRKINYADPLTGLFLLGILLTVAACASAGWFVMVSARNLAYRLAVPDTVRLVEEDFSQRTTDDGTVKVLNTLIFPEASAEKWLIDNGYHKYRVTGKTQYPANYTFVFGSDAIFGADERTRERFVFVKDRSVITVRVEWGDGLEYNLNYFRTATGWDGVKETTPEELIDSLDLPGTVSRYINEKGEVFYYRPSPDRFYWEQKALTPDEA